MVVDAVRTYLDAASGLTELSRKEAVAAAKVLLRAGGPVAPASEPEPGGTPPRVGPSIQALAGELLETSRANREALAELVRAEVEHRLERMDVVPRSEHERLVRRVVELERRLAARQGREWSPAVPAVEVREVEVEEVPAAAVPAAPAAGAQEPPVAEADAPKADRGAPEPDADADAAQAPAGGTPAKTAAKPAAKGARSRTGSAKRAAKARSATKK